MSQTLLIQHHHKRSPVTSVCAFVSDIFVRKSSAFVILPFANIRPALAEMETMGHRLDQRTVSYPHISLEFDT